MVVCVMEITAAQLRAGRALLDLDPVELADRPRVASATVRYIEDHDFFGDLPARDIAALREALETAGVEFIECGVRWRDIPAAIVEVR